MSSYCTVTEDPRFDDIGIKRFFPSYHTAYKLSKEVRGGNDGLRIYFIKKTGSYFLGTKKEFRFLQQQFY